MKTSKILGSDSGSEPGPESGSGSSAGAVRPVETIAGQKPLTDTFIQIYQIDAEKDKKLKELKDLQELKLQNKSGSLDEPIKKLEGEIKEIEERIKLINGGMCQGYIFQSAKLLLSGVDSEKLKQRFDFIATKYTRPKDVTRIRDAKRTKVSPEEEKNTTKYENRVIFLDLLEFFEGLGLDQFGVMPNLKELLEKSNSSPHPLSPVDWGKTVNLNLPKKLEQEGGIVFPDKWKGEYGKDEMESYARLLFNFAKNSKQDFALILAKEEQNQPKHGVLLYFKAATVEPQQKQQWIFFDGNCFPIIFDSIRKPVNLAGIMNASFEEKKDASIVAIPEGSPQDKKDVPASNKLKMATYVMTTSSRYDNELKNLISDLKKKPEFKKLHDPLKVYTEAEVKNFLVEDVRARGKLFFIRQVIEFGFSDKDEKQAKFARKKLFNCRLIDEQKHEIPLFHLAVQERLQRDLLDQVIAESMDAYTPLYRAVAHNQTAEIKALIEQKADMDAKTSENETAIELAFGGKVENAFYLLAKNGASLNKRFEGIFDEERRFYLEMVIAFSTDLNARDRNGERLLHQAVRDCANNPGTLETLVMFGAKINAPNPVTSWTPLHMAAFQYPKALEVMLKHGGQLDVPDRRGWTPLFLAVDAARHGNPEMLKILAVHGHVDPEKVAIIQGLEDPDSSKILNGPMSIRELCNITPKFNLDKFLHEHKSNSDAKYAPPKSHEQIELEKQMQAKRNELKLVVAARMGDVALVKQLLESKVNVNAKDLSGKTAIHYAATQQNQDLITLLLQHGAREKRKPPPLPNQASRSEAKEVKAVLTAENNKGTLTPPPSGIAVSTLGKLSIANTQRDPLPPTSSGSTEPQKPSLSQGKK